MINNYLLPNPCYLFYNLQIINLILNKVKRYHQQQCFPSRMCLPEDPMKEDTFLKENIAVDGIVLRRWQTGDSHLIENNITLHLLC